MSKWTEHVKGEAKRLNTTYGCALSLPEVKESYYAKNPDVVKRPSVKKTPKPSKSQWANFVRSEAARLGISYGCALLVPEVKINYKKKFQPNRKMRISVNKKLPESLHGLYGEYYEKIIGKKVKPEIKLEDVEIEELEEEEEEEKPEIKEEPKKEEPKKEEPKKEEPKKKKFVMKKKGVQIKEESKSEKVKKVKMVLKESGMKPKGNVSLNDVAKEIVEIDESIDNKAVVKSQDDEIIEPKKAEVKKKKLPFPNPKDDDEESINEVVKYWDDPYFSIIVQQTGTFGNHLYEVLESTAMKSVKKNGSFFPLHALYTPRLKKLFDAFYRYYYDDMPEPKPVNFIKKFYDGILRILEDLKSEEDKLKNLKIVPLRFEDDEKDFQEQIKEGKTGFSLSLSNMGDYVKYLPTRANKQVFDDYRSYLLKKFKPSVGGLIGPAIRRDYSPQIRDLLKKVGDKKITNMEIQRVPIDKGMKLLMDTLSLGAYSKTTKKLGYDRVFHLSMIIRLEGLSYPLVVEKNEVINISKKIPPMKRGGARFGIPITKSITLNELLENTRSKQGSQMFLYDAFTRNCQMFIRDLLKNSGLLTTRLEEFIMQDAGKILEGMPWYFSSVAKGLTNLGAQFNRIIYGKGMF